MGLRNYLIDGVSGAGKTSVAIELERRGFQAIHGDRELAYRGDPATGLPVVPGPDGATARWKSDHHIWDVDKVRALIASQDAAITFFCGGSRNSAQFIDLLDGVFVLEVDRDTMDRRIAERVARDPTDFGGTPEERALIAQLFASKAHIPTDAIRIDATVPLADVVDAILSHCRTDEDGTGGPGSGQPPAP